MPLKFNEVKYMHTNVETLVAGNLPDRMTRNIFSWHQLNNDPDNKYSLKSGWNYGWIDITKYCCIYKKR